MTPPRIRPPLGADERTQLVSWLDLQRAIAAWKCEGLAEEDAHRSVLPTSPLMTMAGVISTCAGSSTSGSRSSSWVVRPLASGSKAPKMPT